MAILVPTCCQKVPNLTPRSPKRAQLVAKIAQNTPQEPPTRPPKTPKYCKNAVPSFDLRLSPFSQMSLPRPPKMLKIAPQVASRWPSWPQLGAILSHLAKLFDDPRLAKIGQDSLQENFHAKIASKTSQTPSRLRLSWFWETC